MPPKTTTRVAEERASGNWRRAFDSLLFHDRLRCWGKQDVVAATAAAANAFTSEGGFAAEVHVVGHAFGERIAVWNHDLLGKVAALERLNIGAVGQSRPFSRQHRGERNAPKTTTRVAEERASGNWRRAFDSLLFHDRLRCWGKQDVVAATAAAANAFTSEGGFAAEVHVVGHAFGERIAVWNHDLLGKVAALERLNIGAVGQSQTGKGQ